MRFFPSFFAASLIFVFSAAAAEVEMDQARVEVTDFETRLVRTANTPRSVTVVYPTWISQEIEDCSRTSTVGTCGETCNQIMSCGGENNECSYTWSCSPVMCGGGVECVGTGKFTKSQRKKSILLTFRSPRRLREGREYFNLKSATEAVAGAAIEFKAEHADCAPSVQPRRYRRKLGNYERTFFVRSAAVACASTTATK